METGPNFGGGKQESSGFFCEKHAIFRQDFSGGCRGSAWLRGEGGEELPGDLTQLRDRTQGLRLPQQLQRRVDLCRGPGEWLHPDSVDQEVDVTHC